MNASRDEVFVHPAVSATRSKIRVDIPLPGHHTTTISSHAVICYYNLILHMKWDTFAAVRNMQMPNSKHLPYYCSLNDAPVQTGQPFPVPLLPAATVFSPTQMLRAVTGLNTIALYPVIGVWHERVAPPPFNVRRRYSVVVPCPRRKPLTALNDRKTADTAVSY